MKMAQVLNSAEKLQEFLTVFAILQLLSQATNYASQHIWCLSQAMINWEGCVRKGIWRKMVGMVEMGAPISLDGVAYHLDCWCVCLFYLHFAPENPEDGEMYLLLPAHPGCSRQSPESCKMVVCCISICRLMMILFCTLVNMLYMPAVWQIGLNAEHSWYVAYFSHRSKLLVYFQCAASTVYLLFYNIFTHILRLTLTYVLSRGFVFFGLCWFSYTA